MLRKLIEQAYGPSLSNKGTGLYFVIFFGNLTFTQVALVSLVLSIVGVVVYAVVTSWSGIKASKRGRQLRHDVLERAVKSSGGTEGGQIEGTANDLILKIRVIEDFIAYDEQYILKNQVLIVVAAILVMIFAWFGGLVAIFLFLSSKVGVYMCERQRHKHTVEIEKNAAQINARLLDVIKNGVKIKIMDYFHFEQDKLRILEQKSDGPRAKDAQIKFYREIFQNLLLSVVPAVMGIAGAQFVSQMDSMEDGIDIAYSILLVALILDEAYKGLWVLVSSIDKQVGAIEAQVAIDEFLGTSKKNDKPEQKESSTNGSNSAAPDKDIELGRTSSNDTSGDATAWERQNGNQSGIQLEDVLLHYPGRERPVLDNYSRIFQRGKIHALVGESGSGKSTALKVIADLIEPNAGTMRYWNGMKIAYVSQDQKLFARTIRENIAYGASTEVSDEQIWDALKLATMDDWVKSLPNGLDHHLRNGEGEVSGGQLQRLNLAHLFCTGGDADLVILDEVLSALDPKSRELLLDRLASFLKNSEGGEPKTGLLITHHHEMLTVCDEVHEMVPPSTTTNTVQGRKQRTNELIMHKMLAHSAGRLSAHGAAAVAPAVHKMLYYSSKEEDETCEICDKVEQELIMPMLCEECAPESITHV